MRKEHDFSKGERGKFYRPNAKVNPSVYVDEEVLAFVQRIARRRKADLSSVVNQLLRSDTVHGRRLNLRRLRLGG